MFEAKQDWEATESEIEIQADDAVSGSIVFYGSHLIMCIIVLIVPIYAANSELRVGTCSLSFEYHVLVVANEHNFVR